MGIRGWLDSQGIGDVILKLMCQQTYSQARFCRYMYNLVVGPNQENMDLVSQPPVHNKDSN